MLHTHYRCLMAKNEVRIIGGKWRGRKLKFPDAKGLRPSQDRARETLFNWIAPWIAEARVLDLFAGSGVLGFEALSRGAVAADLVDSSRGVTAALEASKTKLLATDATIYTIDALTHLGKLEPALKDSGQGYDLVFVDPPFNQALVDPVLGALARQNILAEHALVYVEQPKHDPLPGSYQVFRDKTFGDSRALLLSEY